VLAHERGHASARHPLRRFFASLALAFHFPGIARAIERKIALAHEASADLESADGVGDPLRVAEALVRAARLAQDQPRWAQGIGGSDVEARVGELLAPRASGRRALPIGLAITSTAMLAVPASPGEVHHVIETPSAGQPEVIGTRITESLMIRRTAMSCVASSCGHEHGEDHEHGDEGHGHEHAAGAIDHALTESLELSPSTARVSAEVDLAH
jgi:hypothetical protein